MSAYRVLFSVIIRKISESFAYRTCIDTCADISNMIEKFIRWQTLEPWHGESPHVQKHQDDAYSMIACKQILLEVQDFITQSCILNADPRWMRSRVTQIIYERLVFKDPAKLEICVKTANDCGATDGVTPQFEACKCTSGHIFFRRNRNATPHLHVLHGNGVGSVPSLGKYCPTQICHGACMDVDCKNNHVRIQYFRKE